MTAIDKKECGLSKSACADGSSLWARLIGLGLETPGHGDAARDVPLVLLKAGATTCGFALLNAVLFVALR
ncbi:hypothetical protein [Variovorax sp. HJSM1_2]|uniref:hypothetical protein n=1 Tax=Variovorax sp. HJSM1_2 TaxID=3366263 RepID=UPI003BCE6D7E